MIPVLKDFVVRKEPSLAGKALSFIKLHNGMGFRNPKVSFVVFADGRPTLFLKTVRFPKDNAVIQSAHARLKQAGESVSDASTRAGIPLAHWCEKLGEVEVSAESLLAGRPLNPGNPSELAQAISWIERFSKLVKKGEWGAGEISEFYQHLRREMKCVDADLLSFMDSAFARLLSQAGGDALRLPRVPAHGDLTPSNMLSEDGFVRVIDWDRFGEIELPLFDLFTFAERSVAKSVDFYAARRETVQSHAATLGIPVAALPLLAFFSVLLTDWRKRERHFPWEIPLWDRDLLAALQAGLPKAEAAFAV